MSELGDSVIKLFGKTIALPLGDANDCVAVSDHNLCSPSDSDRPAQELDLDLDNSIDQELSKEPWKDEQEDGTSDQISEKVKDMKTSASSDDNPKTPSADVETSLAKNGGEEEDKTESETQDKTLKKPDKILPCPRCNSMDTKFCYYNNYNVNQPRHFCKNCQRYWTAGGTMRNVPVGAGRRKNKNATASHYRHIMVSEALQMARINAASNGNVLTFGSDSPLCDNMASVLNLAEKSQHRVQNGFHRDNGDDHSSGCGSSITGSNSSEKVGNSGLQEANVKNYQAFPPQVPCFPGPPWPCAWNSVQWNPAMHPAAYPVSFYPAQTYWGCTVPGSWNMPLPSPDNSASNSTPNSMVLGKHSRDGNILNPIPSSSEKEEPMKESNSGRSVWIPKTLRIDDPGEAAKSSIWATLGIRNEKTSSISGRGLFKSFQSDNDKAQAMGASAALHANPAAMSRSLNFQENT